MSLIKCPECGETVSDKASNCPHCGFGIAENIAHCPECGSVVPKDAVACPKCAFPLHENKVQRKEEVVVNQQPNNREKELELQRIEPSFSDAKRLFESKSFIEAYNKINIALHVSPNNVECLKLEELIVDGIRESSYKKASDLLQDKQYAKALAEIDTALNYAPNSHKLINLSNEVKSAKSRRRVRTTVLIIVIFVAIIGGVAYSVHNSYLKDNEENAWTEAKDSATVSSLEHFIELYPEGTHSMEAEQLLEGIKKKDTDYWDRICRYGDVSVFQDYKEKFPQGLYLVQADTKIDSLDWLQAVQKNTPEAYSSYLTAHPQGTHSMDAETAQNNIKNTTPNEEEINNVKTIFTNYYAAVEGKDNDAVLEFFEAVTPRYYGITNAKKADILTNLKKMYSKDIKQLHVTLNTDGLKVTKDASGNFKVTFSIDCEYDRDDASLQTTASMIVNAVVNPNQKITSITSKKK